MFSSPRDRRWVRIFTFSRLGVRTWTMRDAWLGLVCAVAFAVTACGRDYHKCEACFADEPSLCGDNRLEAIGVRDLEVARCFAARKACDRPMLGDAKHGALCDPQRDKIDCDAALLGAFTFTCETETISGMIPWH